MAKKSSGSRPRKSAAPKAAKPANPLTDHEREEMAAQEAAAERRDGINPIAEALGVDAVVGARGPVHELEQDEIDAVDEALDDAAEAEAEAVKTDPPRGNKKAGAKAPKPADGEKRGPGRPPKKKSPTRKWRVRYVSGPKSDDDLPSERIVIAPDQGSAITAAHKVNKITDTHRYNVTVSAAE